MAILPGGQSGKEILEPALEIVDPHHHLWDRDEHRYLLDQLLADTGSGHNITHSVFIECGSMYRADGPTEMKPVGEIEFVNGTAAMSASGRYGKSRLCAGIVGHADLRLGDGVARVLEAQIAAGDGRFRGIRHSVTWDPSEMFSRGRTNSPKGQMADATWRAGFARLAPPPEPPDAARLDRLRPEFPFYEFVVVRIFIRQSEMAGIRGFRPAGFARRTAFGTRLWRRAPTSSVPLPEEQSNLDRKPS